MTAPCKGCTDRYDKCHWYCSEYYVFKQKRKLVAKKKEKIRVSTPELCQKVVKQIWKEMRGR